MSCKEEDYAELIDLDEEEFRAEYGRIVETMITEARWYRIRGSYKGSLRGIDFSRATFEELPPPKHLALGRSSYYDAFIDYLSRKCGQQVYQSDYMVWIDPANPYKSLNFYVETAERIDFNLKGLGYSDIKRAVHFGGRAESRRELETGYMTVWELNQVVYSLRREKTAWHVTPELDIEKVRSAFEGYVEAERLVPYTPPEGDYRNEVLR
jgi:hypothetical protein